MVVVGLTAKEEGEYVVAPDVSSLTKLPSPLRFRPVAHLAAPFISKLIESRHEGGGDRRDLGLSRADVALIRAVRRANERTVVVLIGGSAITISEWADEVPAVLMAWYPGVEGGHAVADVLLGTQEPGGRLPLVFADTADHLPVFDPDATHVHYDRWWGQRMLDRDDRKVAFPFGYGLGYTTFELDQAVEVVAEADMTAVRVIVTNTGDREGSTVLQVYAHEVGQTASPAVPVLVGFTRVTLAAGEQAEVDVLVSPEPLLQWDPATSAMRPSNRDWDLTVRQHARDTNGTAAVRLRSV